MLLNQEQAKPLKGNQTVNDVVKNLVLWIVIAVVLLSIFNRFIDRGSNAQSLDYSDFLTQVEKGRCVK